MKERGLIKKKTVSKILFYTETLNKFLAWPGVAIGSFMGAASDLSSPPGAPFCINRLKTKIEK